MTIAYFMITTWTLVMSYQTDAGIKKKYEAGYTSERACEEAGEEWKRHQPHKFDWYIATECRMRGDFALDAWKFK